MIKTNIFRFHFTMARFLLAVVALGPVWLGGDYLMGGWWLAAADSLLLARTFSLHDRLCSNISALFSWFKFIYVSNCQLLYMLNIGL